MNKASTLRVLASTTAITSVIALVALTVAAFYESIPWMAIGLMAAFLTAVADRYRLSKKLQLHNETLAARDEALHARIRQIVTWWQADIQALANGTQRPDPTAVLGDQPPHPRRGELDAELAEQREQRP